MTELLVHQRNQTGPQRGHRAGATNHKLLAIDADEVARSRVRISRDVGNTTTLMTVGVHGRRDVGYALIRWHGEEGTHSAPSRAVGPLVPDHLAGDRVLEGREFGTPLLRENKKPPHPSLLVLLLTLLLRARRFMPRPSLKRFLGYRV
jgi:hypothetical protein